MTDAEQKFGRNLKRFAEGIIVEADCLDSSLRNDPKLQNIEAINTLDPESWRVARHYAEKILAAKTFSDVNRKWVEAILMALRPPEVGGGDHEA